MVCLLFKKWDYKLQLILWFFPPHLFRILIPSTLYLVWFAKLVIGGTAKLCCALDHRHWVATS